MEKIFDPDFPNYYKKYKEVLDKYIPKEVLDRILEITTEQRKESEEKCPF